VGLLGYMLVRYRAGAPGEPSEREGNRRLEIVWTAAPALLLIVLFIITVRAMLNVKDPPADELRVEVIGHQWWWEYRYPDGNVVTANELHLPADTPVRLEITAADVIHSFWVPQLGWKQDAIPNKTNVMHVMIDQSGTWDGACAEYCGAQHAWMRINLIVQPPADFNAWLQSQAQPAAAPADELAQQGQQVFLANTCLNCHAIGGTAANATVGPNLTHLASRATLGAGVIANTPDELTRWVVNAPAVKPGVLMPAFTLTAAELRALTHYLEGLR
jgi:cytochrome c oxidase subunit 2